jgi:hypothetical protein
VSSASLLHSSEAGKDAKLSMRLEDEMFEGFVCPVIYISLKIDLSSFSSNNEIDFDMSSTQYNR